MLGIRGVRLRSIDLGIDVAVRDEDVEPAIVIHIEEADAPAQVASVDAEA